MESGEEVGKHLKYSKNSFRKLVLENWHTGGKIIS